MENSEKRSTIVFCVQLHSKAPSCRWSSFLFLTWLPFDLSINFRNCDLITFNSILNLFYQTVANFRAIQIFSFQILTTLNVKRKSHGAHFEFISTTLNKIRWAVRKHKNPYYSLQRWLQFFSYFTHSHNFHKIAIKYQQLHMLCCCVVASRRRGAFWGST